MLDAIDLLVLDVDGVLTDGRIVYDSRGADTKRFDTHDGQGVRYWLRAGHEAAILSGRGSPTIGRRAREIGIEHVYEDATDKLPVFEKILKRFGRTADRVCYVGDDLVDLPVMARVGSPWRSPGRWTRSGASPTTSRGGPAAGGGPRDDRTGPQVPGPLESGVPAIPGADARVCRRHAGPGRRIGDLPTPDAGGPAGAVGDLRSSSASGGCTATGRAASSLCRTTLPPISPTWPAAWRR